MIIKFFFEFFKLKIGVPIFPPSEHLILFFLKKCANNLQVVDLPFVPVTTMLLNLFLVKKNRSISVIIFFLNCLKTLFRIKLMPGESTIYLTCLSVFFIFFDLYFVNTFF